MTLIGLGKTFFTTKSSRFNPILIELNNLNDQHSNPLLQPVQRPSQFS